MVWRHVMVSLPAIESVPEHVIDRVGRLARGLLAGVELFHCLYDGELAASAPTPDREARYASRIEASRRRLEQVADRLRDQGLEVRSSVRFDYPIFEAVIREVLRQGPGLLIVAAESTGHSGHRALSYTETRLIEACPCPLLLMKTNEVYSKGPIVAAVDPMHARAKPAELDERIIAAAKTLSRALDDAPVHLYHAARPLYESGSAPDYLLECEQETRKLAASHEIPDERVRIEGGPVEARLPLYAQQARADVVVMGAVSRSVAEKALFGHTAERILGALDCDTLIVKPKGFRCPVSRRPRPASRRAAAAPGDRIAGEPQPESHIDDRSTP